MLLPVWFLDVLSLKEGRKDAKLHLVLEVASALKKNDKDKDESRFRNDWYIKASIAFRFFFLFNWYEAIAWKST
jgi:hypothetical protein